MKICLEGAKTGFFTENIICSIIFRSRWMVLRPHGVENKVSVFIFPMVYAIQIFITRRSKPTIFIRNCLYALFSSAECFLWNSSCFIYTLWKKPFCFSFPPENSRIMDRNSRCRYQNNLPGAHRVFLKCPCQKSYGRKIPARNNRYGQKIPAFWCQKR